MQAIAAATTSGQASGLVTEQVPCLVCHHQRRQRLFTEAYRLGAEEVELGINRCRHCGQVYVSPRLDLNSTARVYSEDRAHTISHAYCWNGRDDSSRFKPLLKRLRAVQPSGRLLDVGCGGGHLLAAAQAIRCWQLSGIEPVADAADAARSRFEGELHCATLESAELPRESFDIVTMLGVLEHLHDPAATLRRVHQLLRPRGILAVYVPNYRYLRLKDTGLAAWIRSHHWSRLAPQEHLFHFTPPLLNQLLRTTGYRLLRLDVGRPFLTGGLVSSWCKQVAYAASWMLFRSTGIHLGGMEAIAVKTS
jgi:2-polyprenyl-3-methyl-5-hydroxy-6-metoxy-1,4-benzoquinol methylase